MIQIFVAAMETQGQRENDFCHADEGETVAFNVTTCTGETADDKCGCARSLSGLRTHKATTTMKVHEYAGNLSDLEYIIARSLQEGGWLEPQWTQFLQGDKNSASMASALIEEASKFSVGTIVEYRDGHFVARK